MVKQPEKVAVQGTVQKITYHHPDTNYTVLRLDVENAPGVTVVGGVYPVSEGEEIKSSVSGKRTHATGSNFKSIIGQRLIPRLWKA